MRPLPPGRRRRRLTSPGMSVGIAIVFACPGTGCSQRPPRMRCCGTTTRMPGLCGTWPSSSIRTGAWVAVAPLGIWSSVGSLPPPAQNTHGCSKAPKWCSSKPCETSLERWPLSSTGGIRRGGRRGGKRGGTKDFGLLLSGQARFVTCPVTSARSGCQRQVGCGSAGPARCHPMLSPAASPGTVLGADTSPSPPFPTRFPRQAIGKR
jgi:hypothetical protein